jgi:uncharacterized protein YbjT (DUF2867 family)
MRVMVTGAYGLIGSAVLARLHRDGHAIVGTGRAVGQASRRFPYARWVEADFARLLSAKDWLPLLADVDAVVNCVGVLQEGARDDVQAVQVTGTRALFEACAQAGVRRVIHLSAIGADPNGPTAFSRTKALAEAHLASLDLDWVILRPGLVLGPAVHGGSAILRGIAGIPLFTPLIAADSRMLVVSIDDLVATVVRALAPGAPAKVIWDVAHPQPVALGTIITEMRRWLGFPRRPTVCVPVWMAAIMSRTADALGWLGWRSPARTTAMRQLSAGMYGNPTAWIAATGINPRTLDDILAAQPATVQDRWHARLYFIKPLAIGGLAAFWMLTGLISLGPGWQEGVALLSPGLSPVMIGPVIIAGALLDIVLGTALLFRALTRRVLIIMLLVCIPYLAVATVIDPTLWLDPLGRLTKTVIVMLATLFTLAVLDDR